jgi:sortase B
MKKHHRYILLIIPFIALVIGCVFLIRYDSKYYKIEDKKSLIKKSKKTDTDDYETIGWLKIQGTDIDMPILHAKNKDWDYPVTKENYAWAMNMKPSIDKKLDIMGHNIFNLSSNPKIESSLFNKFEQLMSFVYYDFAKENLYIQFSNDKGDFIYKIFSAGFEPVGYINDYRYVDYKNDKHGFLKEQLKYYKTDSLYNYDVDVNEDDKFITLVTCTRFFGDNHHDFVVSARLLRENEKIDKYDVKVNKKNYKKVEEIMKGGNDNEEDV